jgi:hypothetical protein
MSSMFLSSSVKKQTIHRNKKQMDGGHGLQWQGECCLLDIWHFLRGDKNALEGDAAQYFDGSKHL